MLFDGFFPPIFLAPLPQTKAYNVFWWGPSVVRCLISCSLFRIDPINKLLTQYFMENETDFPGASPWHPLLTHWPGGQTRHLLLEENQDTEIIFVTWDISVPSDNSLQNAFTKEKKARHLVPKC